MAVRGVTVLLNSSHSVIQPRRRRAKIERGSKDGPVRQIGKSFANRTSYRRGSTHLSGLLTFGAARAFGRPIGIRFSRPGNEFRTRGRKLASRIRFSRTGKKSHGRDSVFAVGKRSLRAASGFRGRETNFADGIRFSRTGKKFHGRDSDFALGKRSSRPESGFRSRGTNFAKRLSGLPASRQLNA